MPVCVSAGKTSPAAAEMSGQTEAQDVAGSAIHDSPCDAEAAAADQCPRLRAAADADLLRGAGQGGFLPEDGSSSHRGPAGSACTAGSASASATILSDSEDELLALEDGDATGTLLLPNRRYLHALPASSSGAPGRRPPVVVRTVVPVALSSSDSDDETELLRLERKYNVGRRPQQVPHASAAGPANPPGQGPCSGSVVEARAAAGSSSAVHAACTVSISGAREHLLK
jgi:hypothetical protein